MKMNKKRQLKSKITTLSQHKHSQTGSMLELKAKVSIEELLQFNHENKKIYKNPLLHFQAQEIINYKLENRNFMTKGPAYAKNLLMTDEDELSVKLKESPLTLNAIYIATGNFLTGIHHKTGRNTRIKNLVDKFEFNGSSYNVVEELWLGQPKQKILAAYDSNAKPNSKTKRYFHALDLPGIEPQAKDQISQKDIDKLEEHIKLIETTYDN